MSANGADVSNAVKDTIYRACLALDDQKWDEWLALCEDSFEYAITAFSPEIRQDMTYLSGSFKEMQSLVHMLPKHNTDHSPLKRHAVVYTVDVGADGKTATAVSSVLIYQNMLDGIHSHLDAGENRLFAVGRYVDSFRIQNGKAKFVSREVRLETRRLDKGSHWPL